MDDTQGSTPNANAQSGDEIKNLKAEMQRKLSNLEESNQQLMKFIQGLKPAEQKPAPQQSKKLEDVWYDNQEEAARIIREQTKAELRQEFQAQQDMSQKQQSTLAALVQDFPELSDTSSDLAKKAVENYNQLSDEEKRLPLAYKAAVKDAALELGLKPKKLRTPSEDESFSLPSSQQARAAKKADKENESITLDLAKEFGLELTKERKERLQNKHGRKSYTHWE